MAATLWRRHSAAQATGADKVRLGADFAFLVLLDCGAFLARPWKASALLHGLGILWGLTECAWRPPDFDEASHKIRYQADYRAH